MGGRDCVSLRYIANWWPSLVFKVLFLVDSVGWFGNGLQMKYTDCMLSLATALFSNLVASVAIADGNGLCISRPRLDRFGGRP